MEILEGVNVVLPSGLVVPDLVVADAGATADDPVTIDIDAVQLVVELVAPGNSTMDRKIKPMLYAEAAIPHFWRLEFDPAPMLVIYELEAGRYVERATALSGATTQVDVPFPMGGRPGWSVPPVDAVRRRAAALRSRSGLAMLSLWTRQPRPAGAPVPRGSYSSSAARLLRSSANASQSGPKQSRSAAASRSSRGSSGRCRQASR